MDARLARPLWRGRTNMDALTIACVERAEKIARKKSPATAHEFVVTQGSYQAGAGDRKSAGTHDLGGVVDLRWCGHATCLWALRKAGLAAWHRTPAQGSWPHHIHAVVVGHPYLANAAEEQVDDYLVGRNGLANNGPDDGPRLNPIPRPKWPWPTLPKRIVRYLAETKIEIARLKKGRAAAKARGDKPARWTAAIKAQRAARKAAKARFLE